MKKLKNHKNKNILLAIDQYCKKHNLLLKFRHSYKKCDFDVFNVVYNEAVLVTNDVFHDEIASGFSLNSRSEALNYLANNLFENEILTGDGRKTIKVEEIDDPKLKLKFAILGK